ncbi:UNVERIFIED_CONTAM: hypothetical protein RMT77_010553 [Armadillidium vulgare]
MKPNNFYIILHFRKPSQNDIVYPFMLDYSRQASFPWSSTQDECSSFATRFLVPKSGNVVPLVSFPGSGNSWMRYISESVTGVFSGSLYEDDVLALRGFWGERDSYLEGTTLLQKTHSTPILPEDAKEWNGKMVLGPKPRKAILLIRSPYEALISFRHFHAAGHTGFGHHAAFTGKSWENFTEYGTKSWLNLYKSWLDVPDTNFLVIHYEELMQNLEHEIERYLSFMGTPFDFGRVSCLLRYPEGKLRRPKYPKHLQGYQISSKAAVLLATSVADLNQILTKYGQPLLPTHHYSFHPSIYQI